MYTTQRPKDEDRIEVRLSKPRNKQLHDVLSTRRGGRMQDEKRQSRNHLKQALRRGDYQDTEA